jgi:alanine racemase
VKEVEPGRDISYGRRYRTTRRTQIATIPIGYADGLSRLMAGKAEVMIGGRKYPVVGTICMDAVMVDLQGMTGIRAGEPAVFIGLDRGSAIDAWEVAARTGTIPYEVTSLITQRVPRLFQG